MKDHPRGPSRLMHVHACKPWLGASFDEALMAFTSLPCSDYVALLLLLLPVVHG